MKLWKNKKEKDEAINTDYKTSYEKEAFVNGVEAGLHAIQMILRPESAGGGNDLILTEVFGDGMVQRNVWDETEIIDLFDSISEMGTEEFLKKIGKCLDMEKSLKSKPIPKNGDIVLTKGSRYFVISTSSYSSNPKKRFCIWKPGMEHGEYVHLMDIDEVIRVKNGEEFMNNLGGMKNE